VEEMGSEKKGGRGIEMGRGDGWAFSPFLALLPLFPSSLHTAYLLHDELFVE